MSFRTFNKILGLTAALAFLLPVSGAWGLLGLSSQFINVTLEGLKPGGTYNLLDMKGVPYTVKNRGTGAVDILVEIQAPQKNEITAPFEPIPDPSWLELTPSKYRLSPGEPGFSALTIRIPNDPALKGRHFHADIWAHTMNTGFLAAGVRSSIRFSIGKGPETLAEEERRKAMVLLNYDMWPASVYIMEACPGPYDAKKREKKSFKLTNRAEEDLELVLRPAPWVRLSMPAGYQTVKDLSWVEFSPSRVKMEGESLKTIRLKMDIPEKYRGKKIAFMMKITLPVGTIVNMTNRVLINVLDECKP